MQWTLKLKVALLATALIVVSLAMVGFSQGQRLGRDFRALLILQQDAYAQGVADHLADRLETHRQMLEHAASILDADILDSPRDRQDFLSRRTAARELFDGLAIVDLDGEVLTNHPPLTSSTQVNVRDREYFQQVLATTRPAISTPVRSRTTQSAVVIMAVPVTGPDGRMVAMLAAGLNLQRPNMLGQLALTPVGRTGRFEVVTMGSEPVYVVHPDPARLLQAAPATPGTHEDVVTRKAVAGTNWELRVTLPGWEAAAPVKEGRQQLARDLLVLGIAAAAVAWLLMHRVLRPLSSLQTAFRDLRQDPDADIVLDTTRQDEQGALAREFAALLQELRTRQQELGVVSQASPVGMFRTDPQGEIVYANEACLRILNLSTTDLPRGWLQRVAPEARDCAWAEWQAVVRGQQPFRAVREVAGPDGTLRTLAIHSAPAGGAGGHVGTVIDITEPMAAQKALQVLTAIFEATTDFVVQTDPAGRVTFMNAAARRVLDLAPDAPVSHRSFREFNTPETNERYDREILPAVHAHGLWLGETTVLGAGRRTIPVSHMVIAHRGADGQVAHYSAIMRDISGPLAAAEEARRQGATLHSLADALPSLVMVVGADHTYRYVNREFEAWHGQGRDAVIGQHLSKVLGPDEYEVRRPWVERVLAGQAVAFESSSGGAGQRRYLATTYVPLRMDDGTVDGFIGVAHDITHHRVEATRLMALAHTDPLTGLLNRAGFEVFLEREVTGGRGHRVALLYMDLDHFKPVNDRYGHPAGDELLRQFATRLRGLVRPTDAVARLGGDEFAVVLTDIRDIAHARGVASKVLEAAHAPFDLAPGITVQVGASVGVALGIDPSTGILGLTARADAQLYRAKQGGRGRVEAG